MKEGVLISDKEQQTNKEEVLKSTEEKLKICNRCPLFIMDTGICNPGLWLNTGTGEISRFKKNGYKQGCGCLVTRKATRPGSHCHLGKW